MENWKTWSAKTGEVERKWWVVDASNQTLGRLATQIALILRGKNKPQFTPHIDTGDFVVVVNSEKVHMTGRKWEQKNYYRRSRYMGSVKTTQVKDALKEKPEFILFEAVRGMLPKNKLSRQVIQKLKIYKGSEHPHSAQKPVTLNVKN